MNSISLNLIVLRSARMLEVKEFYETLGLVFKKEQHDKGPVHYSAVINGLVLEIYPSSKKYPPTLCRLGFVVDSIDGAVCLLKDPEGRIIELTQKPA